MLVPRSDEGSPPAGGFRALCFVLALAGPLALTALADTRPARAADAAPVIGADEAQRRAQAGEIVLIDVRSPQEWRQTGVPAGSRAVTIHDPNGLVGFLGAIHRELGGDFDSPIAVICARGTRSSLAQSALSEAGYSQVLNIREGMLGSTDGPGWLARGLPTEACAGC